MLLGKKIRKKRLEKGMKLVNVAQKTGYSQSYISQIERGIINPSVVALQKIGDCFGVPTAFFFESEKESETVSEKNIVKFRNDPVGIVRKDERRGILYPSSHITYQLLSPDLQGRMELLLINSPPGSSTGDESFIHEGQECGVILQGTMEIWVNDVHYILKEGDSITLNSPDRHRWRNGGHDELVAVWCVSPPSF